MLDLPLKAGLTAVTTIASGTASVISEHTLIPLGIFVICALAIVGAAVRVTVAVTRAADKLEQMDERLRKVEGKIEGL